MSQLFILVIYVPLYLTVGLSAKLRFKAQLAPGYSSINTPVVTLLGSNNPYRSTNQCPPIDLANGYVRFGRRTARFRCVRNYTLIGDSLLYCYGHEWSGEMPVCAAAGCLKLRAPKQGTIKTTFRDLYVTLGCNPGYALEGSPTVYCDGRYWNASFVTISKICKKATSLPATSCDFEEHHQCGWVAEEPDRVTLEGPNTFGYRPYGLALADHSGSGHMLVVWSSIAAQSNTETVNRLYSPVYEPKNSESCLTFWYHLGGYDKLTNPPPFKVYIKPDSVPLSEVTPWLFTTTNEAYGKWTFGKVFIPKLNQDWQIVMEFSVWQKVYGLDDLSLDHNVTKCSGQLSSVDNGIVNNWISCKDRCSTSIYESVKENSSCSCSIYCSLLETCCPDYELFCVTNSTSDNEDSSDFDRIYFNETFSNSSFSSSGTTSLWIPYATTTPSPFQTIAVKWLFFHFGLSINLNKAAKRIPNLLPHRAESHTKPYSNHF